MMVLTKKLDNPIRLFKFNNNIENFINFSLVMKQKNENIKEFLYLIFLKMIKKQKKVIDETINHCNEIVYVSSSDYNVMYNMVTQNKKRKIG